MDVTGRAAWMGCGGQCVITHQVDGVTVLDRPSQVATRFEGVRFLPGAGSTRNLRHLPLLAADGQLILIAADGLELAGRIPLVDVVDGDVALAPRFVEEARISTDGRRFFIPSPDGPGFSVHAIEGDALRPLLPAHPAMLVSPSGRYGLTVDPDGDGRYALTDYVSGTSFPTRARFEIDVPFFDVDERFLLTRRQHVDGTHVSAYRLADGELVGTFARPDAAGQVVRVETGTNGTTLADIPLPQD